MSTEDIARKSKQDADNISYEEEKIRNAHIERIKKAGHILQMLDTEGGKLLLEEINNLYNNYKLEPELFVKTVTSQNLDQVQSVDEVLLLRVVGARESLQCIKNYFEECKSLIEKEALKNK